MSGALFPVSGRKETGGRKSEAQRQLRDRLCIGSGRVAHQNAVARGGLLVDCIMTGPMHHDDFEFIGGGKGLFGESGIAGDAGFAPPHERGNRIHGRVGADDRLYAILAQEFKAFFMDWLDDKTLHDRCFSSCCIGQL